MSTGFSHKKKIENDKLYQLYHTQRFYLFYFMNHEVRYQMQKFIGSAQGCSFYKRLIEFNRSNGLAWI